MTGKLGGMNLDQLDDYLQGQLMTCADCRYLPGHRVVPCGWHENLVAATAAVGQAIMDMATETEASTDD